MSEVVLSRAVRSNLLNLQSTATKLSGSQERLSTGLKVNTALDNPTNFFTAQGLKSKANDLSALSDSVSNAVQTIAAADKGLTAITKLVESAQATARQALQTSETVVSGNSTIANPKRGELVSTYNDLLDQIGQMAKDLGYNGVNLLNGDDLSVLFNESATSSFEVEGVTNNAAGLGLTTLTSTSFDSNSSINGTLDDLKGAIDTLKSQAARFGSNLSVVQTRQDFTKSMINVLQTGAANLTLADTNEEAANVLALQTRQQLSSTALSLASSSDQNVLRLF